MRSGYAPARTARAPGRTTHATARPGVTLAPHLALAALDGVGTGRSARTACANAPQPAYRHLVEVERPQAMARPVYGTDLVTLTLAVVLAAGIVFLLAELVPQLVDLMMMPPPLSGTR